MRGLLGEKIGEGMTAEVHAWAPGRVVKLFRPAHSPRLARHEARMTRAAFAAGAPAPEVFDEVTVEGRLGIVMERLDGPPLMQLTRSRTMKPAQAGAILASLCHAVHDLPVPREVLPLRDWVKIWLRETGDTLPPHVAPGILALIERLQPADELCHGDLHPGNVIMTAAGPRLIDWTAPMRGPAALDLGFSHIGLAWLGPQFADDPGRPPAIYAAFESEMARLAGASPAAQAAAMDSYLPVVCALFVLGLAFPEMRERFLQRVDSGLRGPLPG